MTDCGMSDCPYRAHEGCICGWLDPEPEACYHSWLDRPESDTHQCLICGEEGSGPPP